MAMPALITRCGLCSREHSPEQWATLELVGAQEADEGVWLELRNCACRTTLSRHISPERAEVVKAEVASRPKGIDFEQLFRDMSSGRVPFPR